MAQLPRLSSQNFDFIYEPLPIIRILVLHFFSLFNSPSLTPIASLGKTKSHCLEVFDMAPQVINWVIYSALPPEEARHQLAHVNDSKKKSFAAAFIISYLISWSAVIMRFISRRIGRVPCHRDDWSIIVALVRYPLPWVVQ